MTWSGTEPNDWEWHGAYIWLGSGTGHMAGTDTEVYDWERQGYI